MGVSVPWHWRKQSSRNKKRVALSALSLHLTGLVSRYHLFLENTGDILRAYGASTAMSLTSQQGPLTVCAASLTCHKEHWMSEVPALLLMHREHPKEQADLGFGRAWNHCSHSQQPQQMEFANGILQDCCTHSNFTYSDSGASLEVLNQHTRDLQHKP